MNDEVKQEEEGQVSADDWAAAMGEQAASDGAAATEDD